ncbi:MAG: hypothetical protein ACRDJL_00670, partial [Actinomycetota bacterium]
MAQVLERNEGPRTALSGVQGTVTLDDRDARFQRRMILIITIIPFAGFIGALVSLWGWGVSAVD